MKLLLIIIFLIFTGRLSAADELTPRGTYYPQFFAELLDVEMYSPNIIYTFGVGGLVFLDISDLSNPQEMGHFDPGDIYEQRFYNVKAQGSLAIGSARHAGLYFLDISTMNRPRLIKIHKQAGYSYESVEFNDQLAFAAAHEQGIELIDLADRSNPQSVKTIRGLTNAWDVFLTNDLLFVADGSAGIKIYSLNNALEPELLSAVPASGSAKEIIVRDHLALVALGARGMDIFDISNPQQPVLLANFQNRFGIVNHLDVVGQTAFLATWELVMAVDISDPEQPRLIATEDTPTRAMGLAARDDQLFVSDWNALRTYTFQNLTVADIHVKPTVFDFGFKGLNQPITQDFEIFNLGEAALNISQIKIDHFDFNVQPASLNVAAGESEHITVTYQPTHTESYLSTKLKITSNDPDELTREVTLFAGQNRLAVGDSAPDFNLPDVNNRFYRLSDYRGKIVVLAFFASW